MESSFRGYPSNQIPHRHHIFAHPVSEFELELDGPSGSSYYTARSTPGSPSQFDPPTLSGGVPPRLHACSMFSHWNSDKNGSLEGSRLHIPIDLAHKLEPSSPECKPPISSPSEDCPDLSSTLGIASDAARGDRSPASESSSSVDTVRSQQMTSLDMFQCLVKHGCVDLTSFISPEKYSSCRVAEGAFGDIWKGETQDGASVAVKVLRFGLLTSSEGKSLKRMMREIYAWSKLDHENVHKLLGVTMVEGRLGMVSKWMAQGNLRDYLGQTKGLDRHGMCVQIAKGVEYIHSKDMIHGDLKAVSKCAIS
ncbi:unnamed protein product [Rhizoctonia solani]|uniref:Protein kinase domain-containing protein n=1 Tax=Rhizoctonia solani TaxID=456999 RepID=A0A8H2Y363_9AGAM|nr:unnamed protein product [Rhizoctonia solani]